MDEFTDDISSYDEYLNLVKALKLGAERINDDPSRNAIYGIQHLPFVIACLSDPEPTGLFRVYRQHPEPSPDHRDVPFIWDYEVEYNGEMVRYRRLIEKLERLWNEFRMLNEGGA